MYLTNILAGFWIIDVHVHQRHRSALQKRFLKWKRVQSYAYGLDSRNRREKEIRRRNPTYRRMISFDILQLFVLHSSGGSARFGRSSGRPATSTAEGNRVRPARSCVRISNTRRGSHARPRSASSRGCPARRQTAWTASSRRSASTCRCCWFVRRAIGCPTAIDPLFKSLSHHFIRSRTPPSSFLLFSSSLRHRNCLIITVVHVSISFIFHHPPKISRHPDFLSRAFINNDQN